MLSGTRGAGAVFFSGCNLKCIFCQNADISQEQKGAVCDARRLCEIFLDLQAQGAHNIDLVTPTPHLKTIIDALRLIKGKALHIPVVYNTSAYECVEALKALDGLVDIFLPDLKYYSPKRSAAYCGAEDYFIHASAAIQEMYRQVGGLRKDEEGIALSGLIIRHLVLPGNLDETRNILGFIKDALPLGTYIALMRQYTPLKEGLVQPLNRKLTQREYDRALDTCVALGFTNILLQEDGCADSEYVPQFYDKL